ncbi:MAG: dUTP diphosphatase [Lentisphaeria bacterium]|jgi:dUTP pyrophosphatase
MSTSPLPAAFPEVIVHFRMEDGCADLAPRKAHHDDAAYDLRARVDATLAPGKIGLVPTGLFLELPEGVEAQVRPRSGLAYKHGILVPNSPGTIDAGYRGEVCVILLNAGEQEFPVRRGDRIAQLVIQRLTPVELVPAAVLGGTKRGAGGFGSTGVA